MKMFFGIFIVVVLISYLDCAYIYNAKGKVYYKIDDKWIVVEKDKRIDIKDGTEITTERASSVEIYFNDWSKIKIGPISYYKLIEEKDEEISSSLIIGKIRNWVKKGIKSYTVKTLGAVCGVRGTDFFVGVDNEGSTRVEVYDGSVDVKDNKNKSFIVRRGEFINVGRDGIIHTPQKNTQPPQSLESHLSNKMLMQKEIYTEISKEQVIKKAQAEMQMAEYQNRKTAIDAFGYRVRMEEYVIRPSANQFKYVVLNTRQNRFDFGKILFTFNKELPSDLSFVTKDMMVYYGSNAPDIYLTEINSVISNTVDKVTEEASGGYMNPDDVSNPSVWTHQFRDYSFYAAGKNE